MAILDILIYPHPFLKEKADIVKYNEIESLQETFKDMFETMYENNGGGLAATQVGIKKSFFVMDDSDDKSNKMIFINPKIIYENGTVTNIEACLSFPGVSAKVKRSKSVKIEAINEKGKKFIFESDGYLGQCMQHEIDHLNGIVYFDRLSSLKRGIVEKKYKKHLKKLKNN